MRLSIIIPAYNEEQRLPGTISAIIQYCEWQRLHYEIIVIDDGSTDRTREVVEGLRNPQVLLNPPRQNRGKGYSVREGMLMAQGDWILFSDADLSTPFEMIERFLPHLGTADILIASRNLPTSNIEVRQPWFRSRLGKIFPLIVRALVLRGISDTQCGFKLFRKEAARQIFSLTTLNGWGFDVEALFIARKKGMHIIEIPVTWKNSGASKLRPFYDMITMFCDVLAVRWNAFRKRYD